MATEQTFPEFFKNIYCYNHTLLSYPNDVYSLCPMNQLDWCYSICKNEDIWIVTGSKDDIYDYLGPQECKYFYKQDNNTWDLINYQSKLLDID